MVLNPTFAPPDIERERGVILEEIKIDEDIQTFGARVVHSELLEGASAGQAILGTTETVGRLASSSFLATTATGFTREYGVLRAGNSRPRPVCGGCGGEVLHARRRPTLRNCRPPNRARASSCATRRRWSRCRYAWCSRAASDGREPLCDIDPEHSAGRRHELKAVSEHREERGLAYSVYSDMSPYRDTGNLLRLRRHIRRQSAGMVDLILAEFRNLKEVPIGAEELTRAKDH